MATYVDPRVAHGRARHELGENPRLFPAGSERLFEQVVLKAIGRRGMQCSGAEFMSLLERKALPALRLHGLDPLVYSGFGDRGMVWKFVTRNPETGVQGWTQRFVENPRQQRRAVNLEISIHALARCMQRNGVLSLDNIEAQTWCAVHLAPHVGMLAIKTGWLQLAIPTGDGGLFVGNAATGSLRTYIKPGDNDRRSRWQTLIDLFPPFPPLSLDEIREGARVVEWATPTLERISKFREIRYLLRFMSEEYSELIDPVDARWANARRAARQAEEQEG